MTTAPSFAPSITIPTPRLGTEMFGLEDFLDHSVAIREGLRAAQEFIDATSVPMFEAPQPKRSRFQAYHDKAARTIRFERRQERAKQKQRNSMHRELSTRRAIQGEHIGKPGLTAAQIEMLATGKILTNTQGLHLTRSQIRLNQANKRRAARDQQRRNALELTLA